MGGCVQNAQHTFSEGETLHFKTFMHFFDIFYRQLCLFPLIFISVCGVCKNQPSVLIFSDSSL